MGKTSIPMMMDLRAMDNILEQRGYSFFTIFQIMIKISLAEHSRDSHRDKRQKKSHPNLMWAALEDVIAFIEFRYNSGYGIKRFTGFGGMNEDQIIRVKVPKFGDLVKKKHNKWSKDARRLFKTETISNSSRKYRQKWSEWGFSSREYIVQNCGSKYDHEWTARSEQKCTFPAASIFAILPSKVSTDVPLEFEVFKIYSGKPKWLRNEDEQEYERFGDEAGDFIAHLFGKNYLTAYSNECAVVYDYELCHGAYSDAHEEYIQENKNDLFGEDAFDSDETMFTMLRQDDAQDFFHGSDSKYTITEPYYGSESDSDIFGWEDHLDPH